jgi:hypothetical protein
MVRASKKEETMSYEERVGLPSFDPASQETSDMTVS